MSYAKVGNNISGTHRNLKGSQLVNLSVKTIFPWTGAYKSPFYGSTKKWMYFDLPIRPIPGTIDSHMPFWIHYPFYEY